MNRLFKTTNKPNETIHEVRVQLLYWTTITLIGLGIPLVIIGFVEALLLKQYMTAISYLVFYFPILFVAIFQKKLSFKTASCIVLLCLYVIAIINIVIYGFSGAGIPVFLTFIVLTTVFFEIKAGLKAILLCLVPMIIVGFLFVKNILSLDISLHEINTYPISWLTASATLFFLGSLIVISYGVIQKKMLNSLQYSKQQTDNLNKLNVQLHEDVLKRKQTEKELINQQNNLEKKVKVRTKDLEESNEELKLNIEEQMALVERLEKANKEFERFNKLFVDREFRIKELRDEVKELKEKVGFK